MGGGSQQRGSGEMHERKRHCFGILHNKLSERVKSNEIKPKQNVFQVGSGSGVRSIRKNRKSGPVTRAENGKRGGKKKTKKQILVNMALALLFVGGELEGMIDARRGGEVVKGMCSKLTEPCAHTTTKREIIN